METFRSRSINLDSGYLNYQTTVRAMWRLAFLKARIAGRVVTNLLQTEQGQPASVLVNNYFSRADKRKTKTLPGKAYQPTTKKAFNGLAYNTTVAQAGTVNIESKNQINQLENMADMSSAQIVLAVIRKQQVEWMKDTKNS